MKLNFKSAKLWILILIILLAFILRFWRISEYPAGFNADEAAIGYSAYSLLKTGKDEYGTPFPLSFKSFGDYKPGLYFYFVIPSILLFGLTEFAVRLPSVLFGVGTVLLLYFISKEIFKNDKVALLSAFLLAITPWHINFSRASWETNCATFFITLGVYLFLKKDRGVYFIFGSLFAFLTAMYVYQSPRLVVPIFVLGLVFLYFRELKSLVLTHWKKYLISFVILGILSLPLVFQFLGGNGSARFNGLSFLADPGPINRINELRGEHQNPNSLTAQIFHNKISTYLQQFLGHYLDHFSGSFLFITGDPITRNLVPETGEFYLIESLFLIIGLIGLLRAHFKEKWLIILWLLVSPLASSLTYQTPNAVRSLTMVVSLTLIMGYGFYLLIYSLWFLKNNNFKLIAKILVIGLFLWIAFETAHYLEEYYIHYPKRYPLAWEYGFSQMVPKLQKLEGNYKKIVITDKYDQPYILLLFYKASLAQKNGENFNPGDFQNKLILSERDKFNFGTIRSFDNYQFREIKSDEVLKSKDTLFVLPSKDGLPNNIQVLDEVKFPNGEDAFVLVGT